MLRIFLRRNILCSLPVYRIPLLLKPKLMHTEKKQIVFSNSRRLLLAVVWLFISCFSIAQNPLSPALGFQLFTQNGVTFKGGTVNGAIATGGNFNVNGYSSYNATTTAGSGLPYVAIGGNNYALVTGGSFNPLSGYFLVNGTVNNWIKFGSLNGAVNGTNNAGQIKLLKNNVYVLVNSTRQTFNQVQGNGLIDFNSAFTALKNNAASLSACPNNVTTSNFFGLTFLNLNSSKNIWNITGTQLNSISTLYFTSAPSSTKPLVINVNAAGAFSLKMPLLSGVSAAQAPYIIFNFYNATSITQSGNDILGSVLAPNATWVKSGTQKITGQVIAQSFTQTYGALEHAPFSTNLAGCIVCATSTNAGTAQTQCNNPVFTLAANAAPTGATGSWSVVNGTASIASINSPTSTVTINGTTATLRWTVSRSGCASVSSDVVLTNNQISSVAGAAQTQCNNPVFTLAANAAPAGATGSWSVVNGSASIASINSPASTVTISGTTATLRWTVSRSGCADVSSETVLINNLITADAGTDQTQTCNGNRLTLNANPAENGQWTLVSGNAVIDQPDAANSSVQVIQSPTVLRWTVTGGSCTVTDEVTVSVTRPLKVVVLGSSTSYGYGASPIDSAWAYKFDSYLKSIHSQSEVVNLAVPGYTSYHVLCPTGFVPESNRPDPDDAHNITAALQYQPDAIIVNLPTNDIANGFSLQEYSRNFDRTLALTNAAHIPVWVTTSQPRNTFSPEQIDQLLVQRDWTYTRFGSKAIDFWSTIANASNLINDNYNVDGIHVNNEGHDLLYRSVLSEGIPEAICLPWNNQAPVALAGADVQLSNPGNVALSGAASYDSDGVIVSYSWQQISGSYISLGNNTQSSLSLNVPFGMYQFALTVTDDAGATATDTVSVTVGTRILIDAGSIETTSAPDAQGKYWNNLTNAASGAGISGLVTTVNNPTSLSLEVTSRIDGTFDTNGNGLYGYNPVGDVGDYPASATSDYAFAHTSATNGSWTFGGLDEGSEYRFKFWGSKNADNRWIEIRKSGETEWKSYDAGNNSNYDQAAYFTVTGQKTVQFEIRVKDGSSFGYISVVDINATPLISQPLENLPPVSKAGADKVIDLQTADLTLDGSASNDSDGQIVNWQWRQISGTPVALEQENAAVALLSHLEEGTYLFELTVTDNDGAVSSDTVQVSKGNRILIDFGSIAPSTGADFLGHYWNNVQSVVTDASLENLVNVSNQTTGIKFSVPSRIDGDFDVASNGLYGYNTTGTVGDYPATATSDYAFAHNSTDKGQWQLTGLDATKQYTVKFWGTKDAASRWIEIRLAGTEQWQSYDAGFNNDYTRAASFTFSGVTEATFEIRVKSGSSFGYINVVDVLEIKTSKDASVVSARKNTSVAKPTAPVTATCKVWPNPSNGNFTVQIPATGIQEKISLQLVSLSGQVLYQQELNSLGNALNLNVRVRPAAGLYLLKLKSSGKTWMQQVVIQ